MLHPKRQHIVDIYGKEPETLNEVAESCIAVISENSTLVAGFAWDVKYQHRVSNSHNSPIDGYSNFAGKHGPDRDYPGLSGRVWIRYAENPDFMSMSSEFEKTCTHTGTGGGGAYEGIWQAISSAAYRTRTRNDIDSMHTRFTYKYPEPHCFSYDYKIFLSDFPHLQTDAGLLFADDITAFEEEQDRQVTWHKLKGKYYSREKFPFRHKFEWTDPILKAADEKFLAESRKSLKQDEVSA